jgi:phosphatidylglycerol:prolipoprotein diacylglycerol transferase
MYPELFRYGNLVISSYGVLLVAAFWSGLYVFLKMGHSRRIDTSHLFNLSLYVMIAAIAGARLFYVIMHWDEFADNWLGAVIPIQKDGTFGLGGLIFLGGLIAAVLIGIWYVRRYRLPLWKTADSAAPAVAVGIIFGRIGCFLNGCCFGKVCNQPWGIYYPDDSYANAIIGAQPLHPTQLYDAALAAINLTVLLLLNRKNLPDGMLAAIFLMIYGISRITVDVFRYYESAMMVGGWTVNQWISFVLFVCGAIIVVKKALLLRKAQ